MSSLIVDDIAGNRTLIRWIRNDRIVLQTACDPPKDTVNAFFKPHQQVGDLRRFVVTGVDTIRRR